MERGPVLFHQNQVACRIFGGLLRFPPALMPTPISPADMLGYLRWRYATKKFDPEKKIPSELWAAAEQSLVLAPSSYGLQPWKFLVVTNPAVRAKLRVHAGGQGQTVDCSHFVVFAVHQDLGSDHVDRYIDRIAEVRGSEKATLGGFRKMLLGSLEVAAAEGRLNHWQTHQVYIALGQFMAVAAILQIDTCPMEGIEQEKFDQVLGLEGTGYKTVVACAAGYRAADDKYAGAPKVRFAAKDVIVHI